KARTHRPLLRQRIRLDDVTHAPPPQKPSHAKPSWHRSEPQIRLFVWQQILQVVKYVWVAAKVVDARCAELAILVVRHGDNNRIVGPLFRRPDQIYAIF